MVSLATLTLNGPASAQFIESAPARFVAPGSAPRIAPAPAGSNSTWLTQVLGDIEASEYEIRATGAGFSAPNRAQDLRFDFATVGFRVRPRTAPAGWQARFVVEGLYRGDRLVAAPGADPTVSAQGTGLSFEHEVFRVDYTNDPRGMRQNFVVFESPAGPGDLAVALTLDSELSARLSGATTFELIGEDGSRVISYSDLKAWDAEGTPLDAAMRWDGTTLRLEVDDRGAAYPVTIDPLSATADWTVEADQFDARLGAGVGSAGDVNGDGFGDVIVGAPMYDGGSLDEGRAWVYFGSATGLSTTAGWTGEINLAGARFGVNARSAGDVNNDGYSDVIVGADEYSNPESKEGAAFVFHGSATGPSLTPDWSAESNQANALFGTGVASAGDVNKDGFGDVIVGAPSFDATVADEGRAYVYYGSLTGLSSVAAWTADPTDISTAFFGRDVSSAGDVNGDLYADVIVGANGYENPPSGGGFLDDEGGAFVYYGSAGGLSVAPDVTLESNQASAFFGRGVAGAGDINNDGFDDVLVGSPGWSNPAPGEATEGKVWLFKGSGAGLSSTAAWTAESNVAGSNLGLSVAGAGDVDGDGYDDVLAGAYSQAGTGKVYLFKGSATIPSAAADWTATGTSAGGQFGIRVASAGDVNGDGKADVIVGANVHANGQSGEGGAFVYYGTCAGCFGVSGTAGTGNDTGWRMFAPPVTGATRADISNDINLSATTGSALYSYDGGYVAVTNDATALPNGRGYLLYIFDDATEPIGAGGVAITFAGSPPITDVAVGSLNVNNRWHLLGNPFGAAFDLSSLDLVAEGFQATVQIWDWSIGSWTLVTQDAGVTDVIAKGQGFFAERSVIGAGGTTLTFLAAGQTTGGNLIGGKRGSAAPVHVAFHLEAVDASGTVRAGDSTARLLFEEAASEGWDPWDASRLAPPFASEYALLAMTGLRSGAPVDQAQRSHPVTWTGDASFPVVIRTKGDFSRFRIRWPSLESVPPHWTLSLRDATTGAEVDLRTVDEYVIDGPVADGRLSVVIGNAEGVGVSTGDLPDGWTLESAYPNPFNPSTTIVYHAPEASRVLLTVHDALGRRVATLVDGIVPAGKHETTFEGKGLASGVYLYALRTGSQHIVRRMTLAK